MCQLGCLRIQCYFLSTACCCFAKSDGSDKNQMKSDRNCGPFGFGTSTHMGLPITVKQQCFLRHLGKCCCPKGARPGRMSRTAIRSRIAGWVQGIWIMAVFSTSSFITIFSIFRYSTFTSYSCSDETLELVTFLYTLCGQKHKMSLCTASFWYSAKLFIWSVQKIKQQIVELRF